MSSNSWYASLAEMIGVIGDDAFCLTFANLCETMTGYDSTVIIAMMTVLS